MSADGSITLKWADGEYQFRLALGQLRELQENVNRPRAAIGAHPVGPGTLLGLLRSNAMLVDDVRETIRLGLIGGGTVPARALGLVERYVDARPLAESVPTALSVLMAAVVGVPDDPASKKKTKQDRMKGRMTGSNFPTSTEPAQQ